MIQWDILVKYGGRDYQLMAEVEGKTERTMDIRVFGMKSTILLRNNYPGIHAKGKATPMMWNLVNSKLDESKPDIAKLLADIIQQLEPLVRNRYPMQHPMF